MVSELVSALSARPELAAWLVNEDLVRRFVASVNNIADGRNPRQNLEFLRPIDVSRPSTATGAWSSIRRATTATTWWPMWWPRWTPTGLWPCFAELTPLIDDAYAEISPPGSRFDDRLTAAFDELLPVPVVDGDVEVEQKVLTFAYFDVELEGLSPAQRQLLRMGPDNVRKVQAKLRELKDALGRAV